MKDGNLTDEVLTEEVLTEEEKGIFDLYPELARVERRNQNGWREIKSFVDSASRTTSSAPSKSISMTMPWSMTKADASISVRSSGTEILLS